MEEASGFSLAAAGVREITDIQELHGRWDLQALSLHGNELTSIRGLESFQQLRTLNLSANALTTISGLDSLTALTALDLSSNRLDTLQGLEALGSLQRLSLAHNFLCSLEALSLQQTPAGSLSYLNVKNNRLADLEQLAHLAGCRCLQELILSGGEPGNDLSHLPDLRAAAAFALPQLQKLDGRSLTEDRGRHALVTQQLAAARLAAFQPPQYSICPSHPYATCALPCCAAALEAEQPNSSLAPDALEAVVARLAPYLSRPGDAQPAPPHTASVGCQSCEPASLALSTSLTQTEPHPLEGEVLALQHSHAQQEQQAQRQQAELQVQLRESRAGQAALQQQLNSCRAEAEEGHARHEQQVLTSSQLTCGRHPDTMRPCRPQAKWRAMNHMTFAKDQHHSPPPPCTRAALRVRPDSC